MKVHKYYNVTASSMSSCEIEELAGARPVARNSTSSRGVVVPPSLGLMEFRRRAARSRRSKPWVAIGIWAGAFGLLLLLASLAMHGSNDSTSPTDRADTRFPPTAAPTPAPQPATDLPVIRLSRGTSEPAAGVSATPQSGSPSGVYSNQPENPFVALASSAPETELDRLVLARLTQLGIDPAPLCSDSVFLRRAYLVVIGTLPTADEVREFLNDESPAKRAALIDQLLERPEFADYWAMRWCDVLRVKAEFPINLWPNAAQAYHRWIRTALRDNLPYNQFARELLTASGSNFRTPQVNFYRAMQSRDAESIAKTVALTFMGERAEQWPQTELQNLTVFFAQVGYKATGEWKEQIVLFDPRLVKRSPEFGSLMATLPDGSQVVLPEGTDPRLVFADWLIDGDNPRFVR
ncbi:MAG: DUF1549 domain-containing protein, partial [Planctomycetaceae bacterium]|nr:DUF1549 domain-containing protein [Planctomycetaceae bacterium]